MSIAFAVPASAVWRDELWDTILDLSALLETGSWVLVGGHAVMAHALAHDGDCELVSHTARPLGRLVTTASAMPMVIRCLRELGFTLEDTSIATEFRFSRPSERESLSDVPQQWVVDVTGVTSLNGGDQALERCEPRGASKGLRAPSVPLPSLLASIVYEAAQFGSSTTEPFVHARNAALLASLVPNPISARQDITPADRRILRVLDAAVGLRQHSVWSRLPIEPDAFIRWKLLLAE